MSKKPEQKLRVRQWRMLEVLPLDSEDDDFDGAVELCTPRPKKKKKIYEQVDLEQFAACLEYTYVLFSSLKYGWSSFWDFSHYVSQKTAQEKVARPRRHIDDATRVVDDAPKKNSKELYSSVKDAANPELDTVRLYFDCSSFIDLDLLLPCTANKTVRSVCRAPNGEISHDIEFYRTEMLCSWWGKMTISKEIKKFGTNGQNHRAVLSFEYSVAKWWHYASAVNSGDEPCSELLLVPCIQAMKSMRIEKYSSVSFKRICELFFERAELRRFDLSLNFDVPRMYKPGDYVDLLARCRLNRSDSTRHGEGSISFGTEKSPYRAIWYDKEAEAKRYYALRDKTPRCIYFEDKNGRMYKTQSKNGDRVEKVLDITREKKYFYERNKDKFENKLRFEIQFRTKFIQEHKLMSCGKENIDNIIRLGSVYWREALDQFDEQLRMTNFDYKESDKEPVVNALTVLEERRDNGVYSRTKANNMLAFIQECYKKGWRVVKKSLGSSLFSNNYLWVKNELNYDVKVALPEQLPIMRIMPTLYLDRQGAMIRDFRLCPAPIQRCAI